MKRLLIISGLLFGSFWGVAQETARTEEYCEFTLDAAFGTRGRCAIRLDQGQPPAPWPRGVDRLRDEQGNLILFNSAVDALNYLNGYGWRLIDVRSDSSDTYYLMRRTIDPPNEPASN